MTASLRSSLAFAALSLALVGVMGCSGEDASPEPVVDAGSPPASSTAPPPAPSPPPVDAGALDAAPPPLDVPASLVAALGDKTYVEDSCESTTYPGWPYPAQKCTYRNNLVVTIANPTPDRVARWIVEASSLIPALDELHVRDRANWEAGLEVIAAQTIGQSSRIFPLEGKVYEDGTAYSFERGVTSTCSSGCYCRINSTSRQQWCKYATTVLATEPTESGCLSKYGQTDSKLTDDWLAHCFDNHVASWTSDRNEHYRAQAWAANLSVSAKIADPKTAAGADIVAALKTAYGF
jgi:hypothetical protein